MAVSNEAKPGANAIREAMDADDELEQDDELDTPEPDEPQDDADADSPDDEVPEGEEAADGSGAGDARTAAEGGAPGAAAAPADDDFQPVTFNAGGMTYQLDGAVRTGDGMFIPTERVQHVIRAIERGVYHEGAFQQELKTRDDKIANLSHERSQVDREAETILEYLKPHFETGEKMQALVDNWAHHRERMTDKVAAALATAKAEHLAKFGAPPAAAAASAEDADKTFRENASKSLFQYFDNMTGQGPFRGMFSAEETKELTNHVARHARSYITTSTVDLPEQGIKKGDKVIDLPALHADIDAYAKRLGRTKTTTTNLDKAKRTNAAIRRTPRTPNAGARPSAQPSGETRKGPANRKQWMEGINNWIKSTEPE